MAMSFGTVPNDAEILRRLQSEYLEMPGLVLTSKQAARLVATPDSVVDRFLDRLVCDGFLRKSPVGAYLRA
jgi:hypothetical protein